MKLNPQDQYAARELLENGNFQRLYGRMYRQKRSDLLDDLLNLSRQGGLAATAPEEVRSRAISEICGQVDQMQDFVTDLFTLAAYKEQEVVTRNEWKRALDNHPQESEPVWNKPQQREQHRLLKLATSVRTAFYRIITSIRSSLNPRPSR